MSVVQTTYPNFHDALVVGQVADVQTCDIDTGTLEGTANVGFGVAVQPGANDKGIVAGAGRAQVALLDAALNNSATTLSYDGVRSSEGFRVGQYVVVDSEVMHVSAAGADLTVARGVFGTTAAAHTDNSPVLDFDSALFAGVTVMDQRLRASQGVEFEPGDPVPVLHRGDIAVAVAAAVSTGDAVTVDAAGAFGNDAADGTHIQIPNARFIRTATAGGISVVRIAGLAPVNVP